MKWYTNILVIHPPLHIHRYIPSLIGISSLHFNTKPSLKVLKQVWTNNIFNQKWKSRKAYLEEASLHNTTNKSCDILSLSGECSMLFWEFYFMYSVWYPPRTIIFSYLPLSSKTRVFPHKILILSDSGTMLFFRKVNLRPELNIDLFLINRDGL